MIAAMNGNCSWDGSAVAKFKLSSEWMTGKTVCGNRRQKGASVRVPSNRQLPFRQRHVKV
jgi:hypothetical protein